MKFLRNVGSGILNLKSEITNPALCTSSTARGCQGGKSKGRRKKGEGGRKKEKELGIGKKCIQSELRKADRELRMRVHLMQASSPGQIVFLSIPAMR